MCAPSLGDVTYRLAMYFLTYRQGGIKLSLVQRGVEGKKDKKGATRSVGANNYMNRPCAAQLLLRRRYPLRVTSACGEAENPV